MRLLGVFLVALGGATGCVTAGAKHSGAPPIALAPCHLERLAEEVLCGSHEVFENRQAGTGRRLTIQVAVMPALRRTKAPDPLYILAGGPGQGARGFAPVVARFFKGIRRTRDVVLVDLRGTGGSAPLQCPRPGDELTPASGFLLQAAEVARCVAHLQGDPRYYTHTEALADLDEIRQRLGHQVINLWGGSWGTRAALLYTLAYPDAVRSVVLDGAVSLWMEFPRTAAATAERAFATLIAACAADAACVETYPDGRALLAQVLAAIEREGIVSTRHPRTGAPVSVPLSREAVTEIVRVALYTPTDASRVFALLRHAASSDYGPLLAQLVRSASVSSDDMALGQTMSILCSEDLPVVTGVDFARDAAGAFTGSSYADAWRDRCDAWPRGQGIALSRDATSTVPAFILSGEHDPVTPPSTGDAMARHFPNNRHIVVPGAAHNASFSGCVPDLIAAFIARDEATLDTTCVAQVAWPPVVTSDAGTRP